MSSATSGATSSCGAGAGCSIAGAGAGCSSAGAGAGCSSALGCATGLPPTGSMFPLGIPLGMSTPPRPGSSIS